MVLSSEEDKGGDDVGVVGDEFVIEIHKAQERTYSLDRGGGVPIPDG